MLNKEQLENLRQQIILCSLHYSDYENDMGIDSHICSNFFDGYADYLSELMDEDGHSESEFFNLIDKYDNADNLENWYLCYEYDPLPTEFVECQWCHELFDPCQGKHELNMGFLCDRCIDALWSRGEKLYLEV